MNIVVVDDEPSIVHMCSRVLEAQGHTVVGFTKAEEALQHITSAATDLVVVDYKMPELNGLDFIKRAWTVRPGIRVVMITAHGTREVIGQATETGVQHVVLKPFTPIELTRSVEAALEGPPDR